MRRDERTGLRDKNFEKTQKKENYSFRVKTREPKRKKERKKERKGKSERDNANNNTIDRRVP